MRSWQMNRQWQRYVTGCCPTCAPVAKEVMQQQQGGVLLHPHVEGHLIGRHTACIACACADYVFRSQRMTHN
jgi:predicted nucleic acid-binding Zn ribbon protein